jgi:hypothetical protein
MPIENDIQFSIIINTCVCIIIVEYNRLINNNLYDIIIKFSISNKCSTHVEDIYTYLHNIIITTVILNM